MIIALLTKMARSIHLAQRRRKARRDLRALNDHMLRDIGIERHQIAVAVEQMVTLEGASAFEPNRRLEPVAGSPSRVRSLPPIPGLPKAA